jgi:hypothetical protein
MVIGILMLAGAGVFLIWTWRPRAAGVSSDDPTTGERALWAVGIEWRDQTPSGLEDLVTADGIRVVREADRVEFFKLIVDLSEKGISWRVGQRRNGSAAELAKAREVLLSADVYSWDRRGGHKRCGGFQPRDAVRFWRGRESVLFLICFTCADVGVLPHDSAGRARQWMIADVQPGQAKLKGLMEGVFPGTVGEER